MTMTNGAVQTTKTRKTPVRVSLADAVAIHKALEAVLTRNGDNTCTYAPGWSDDRIASETGMPDISIKSVRKKAFGSLYFKAKNGEGKRATKDLAELHERVARIEDKVDLLLKALG